MASMANVVQALLDLIDEIETDLISECEDNDVMADSIREYFKGLREEYGASE